MLLNHVWPDDWEVRQVDDENVAIFAPPDELIPSRDYEYLRMVVAKSYGLTLAQTEDKTAREIALMAGMIPTE